MRKCLTALTVMGFLFLTVAAYAQQQPPAKPQKPVPQGQPGPNQPAQQGPLAKLADYLKLTPEQIQKFKDFQKARQDEQKSFRDQMQKLRGDLRPMLKDQKADQGKINGLIDQIAKLGADRTKQVLGTRGGVQKILTPEQAEKLKNAGPAIRQRLMNFGRGQGMGPGMQGRGQGQQPMGRGQGMGPGGQGQMMRPGMRGQGRQPMGRGQMMRPGMGMRGQGHMMRPGMIQHLMQRFPVLRRLLQMRRMGGRMGAWW
jgi:Spy/CpxP family protein refolding chaperone